MRRWRMLPIVAAAVLAVPALAQQVRFEKYQLPNGMTVILHEDHALPVVAVNTWYRVGAKDEPRGRSGFAHLFEHLMFMGTQRVPGGDFDAIMEAGGGSNNASTAFDRTNYFSTGPSSLLPTLLWLDADRLEDLGRAMNQEKLNKQRDVVRNEIRQNVENRPYGRAEEEVFRIMYPPGHPHHNAVYGTHEDLEAATVHNVQDFFATYYVPNNASLVVAGDFDPGAVKPLIASLFGTLPRGERVDHTTAPPARLAAPVHRTMLDKVQLPLVKMVWHSPAYYAEGDAEMDLVGALLSQGKNSRLYRRLVMDDKLAVDVSAVQSSSGLGSLFIIDITARPEADLNRLQAAADEELRRLIERGPEEGELRERQATVEMAKLSQLQSVLAVADKLNEYEFYLGEPASFERDLDRYRKATPGSVRGWAQRVINPAERLVMRVLPEEPERTQTARDARPVDLARATFSPPPPEEFALGNGMKVMLWPKPELPLVAAAVVFAPGGALYTPERAGLPALAAKMLDEGAGDLDALAFSAAMQSLGAQMSATTSQEAAGVSLIVLKRHFGRAAALMADAVRRPRMGAADWERVKGLHLEELKQQDDEPTIVAARVGLRALYGAEHPYGWPADGTPERVSGYTLEDVKREHARVFRPDAATILVAGAVTASEARAALERAFGDWSAPRGGAAGDAPVPPGTERATEHVVGRVVLVDRPRAVQTVIRFMTPGPVFRTEHRAPLRLLNTLLGGGFTSRLNQNLREDKGYTYGAGSRFVMAPSTGYFVASSSVKSEVTGEALEEFLKEFGRLRAGDVSAEEAGKARESLRTDTIQSFEGLQGLLGAAQELVLNGLPITTIGEDMAKMERVEAPALNTLARSAIPLGSGVLVLVGDRAAILAQIKDMGLPAPVEVDLRGNPVVHSAAPE
ncbi:MAG: pitrilysin family protein [Phycisphaerales bacterium]